MSFGTGSEPLGLSLLWLRDVCTCPQCVDPHSGQKNFSTSDLPDIPKVRTAETTNDGSLRITWEGDILGDVHESIYPPSQLQKWRTDLEVRTPHRLPAARTLWNRSTYQSLLNKDDNKISYKDWTTDRAAFWRTFSALSETGLVFITDVPYGETEVERIANQIGILQHTFYGFTWDVKSKPRAENVAYTSQFLGLHQDLMYHVPIPRLQLLHCLDNSCEGGESIFSDGVRAAYELKLTQPEAYRTLTQAMVHFYYDKEPHFYEMIRPTVSETEGGLIDSTHWAPPFQAPFKRDSVCDGAVVKDGRSLVEWKRAAAAFESNISAPENMVEVKLNPGECIIFDNWRVFHGRREFATGEGSRWLKGTYITDQVFRAMQDKQPRETPGLPDLAEFRGKVADKELEQVTALIAGR